jgi:DNA primase
VKNFTGEELAVAKSADLVDVASCLGFTPRRVGRCYTLREMDSIRIYDRRNWYRWSRAGEKGHDGGSQIDFLREFAGLDLKAAVAWLLDFVGYDKRSEDEPAKPALAHVAPPKEEREKREFVLPKANENSDRVIAYLYERRGLGLATIRHFLDAGLLYESAEHHNAVFKGNDAQGVTRFASMRGTYDREGAKPFKCDVAGNDKNYGFNVTNPKSNVVLVFEGAIDLMSHADATGRYDVNMLALGMTADAPLERFLSDHPQVRYVILCLDNDEAGRSATERLMKKYYEMGYEVRDCPPPNGYKDVNEWLVASKRGERSGRKVPGSGAREER